MTIHPRFKNLLLELVSFLIYSIANICYYTSRKKLIDIKIFDEVSESKIPTIYVIWHGRFFPCSFIKSKQQQLYAIVSQHTDGEIIAKVLTKFGVIPIRGSTNRTAGEQGKTAKDRGGSKVIRESVKALKSGGYLSLTPDGPKGPERIFKKNILQVAAHTGAQIVPIGFSSKRAIIFKTWDSFLFPTPFDNICVKIGSPIKIKEDISEGEMEEIANEIQRILNNITNECDEICGLKK
jgi:lysophospholipid acyltransferase (LPLAT)-like uncharacterized protein